MSAAEISESIRRALQAEADEARAPGQQAYMKSAMPFYGVPVPRARKITTTAIAGISDPALLHAVADELWSAATHREERYAAMATLGSRYTRAEPAIIPLVERMIREGAWWDITDELAHRIADILDRHPLGIPDLLRDWATDEDLWIRRVAIIAQLGRKERLDPDLLAYAIECNSADKDFFIRKAIGWALRDYARVQPEWVLDFLETHELSPLSVREAKQHL